MLRIGAVRDIRVAPIGAEGGGHVGGQEGEPASSRPPAPARQSRKRGAARHAGAYRQS